MSSKIQPLLNLISTYSTQKIIDVLWSMNKKWIDTTPEERMVQLALFTVYEDRKGEDAIDSLQESLLSAVGELY
mgnify:CR=1 FL=1|jgi:hypothetical protein